MPAQYGVYIALGALLGCALFSPARQVITGPGATASVVYASIIVLLTASGPVDWVDLTVGLKYGYKSLSFQRSKNRRTL
jgi:MFS superfamily sulfate permease-like transporter